MDFVEVMKTLEKRRYNLINTLESGRDDIELSKQHQLYGAIKELENVMKTMEHHKEEYLKKNFEVNLSREEDKSFMQKISMRLSSIRQKNTEE